MGSGVEQNHLSFNKMRVKYLPCFVICVFIAIACKSYKSDKGNSASERVIYLDIIKGQDSNPGTPEKPLQSIEELNRRLSKNSCNVYFASGQVFVGTIVLKGINGTKADPVKISSSGEGRAVIIGGNQEAVKIENCTFVTIANLNFIGNGRKEGNKTNGVALVNSRHCTVENVSSKGFQKSGIDLYNCVESVVRNAFVSDNGFSGINVMGSSRSMSRNLLIQGCRAENNPGDPTNLDNHSGNGILVGVSDSVEVDHCSATNNGWDMPRKGNGPVGIWAWESDHVLIQYCISYRNKTSENAKDGGGFDLDGGVRNSVIQYCLSYENQGAGYGLFQYSGASDWSDNSVRYCVSINDGQTTEGSGGIFIWNGSDEPGQLVNCIICNNVIYNASAPAISYENASKHQNFLFCNNIFLGSDQPISGTLSGSSFVANDWWDIKGGIRFMKFPDLESWALKNGQETFNGKYVGMQIDPKFAGPLITEISDPYQLDKLTGYMISPDSPLNSRGLDLKSFTGKNVPVKDFFGNSVPSGNGTEPGINEIK